MHFAVVVGILVAWLQIVAANTESLHETEKKVMHDKMGIDDFDDETFFRMHDLNHDGFLDQDEVARVFLGDGHDAQSSREQTQAIFKQIDKNGDNAVSLAEFLAAARSEQKFDVPDGAHHGNQHHDTQQQHHQQQQQNHHQPAAGGHPNPPSEHMMNQVHRDNIPPKYRL